jgi:hypothetical protein
MQDALLLHGGVPLRLTAAMVGCERRESRAVEAGDEVRDGIAALAPGGACGVSEGLPGGDSEQGFGTRDAGGGFGPGAAKAFQHELFLGSEGTEGILLAAGHGQAPRETRGEHAAR